METQRFDLFEEDDEVEEEEEVVATLKFLPSAAAAGQAAEEQEFPLALGREYVVGNDGGVCDIVLDLSGLSKQHARLTVAQDIADSSLLLLAVKDLASTNGTFYQSDEGKQVRINKNKVVTLRVPAEVYFSTKVKATVVSATPEAQTTQAATPVPSEAATQAQLPPDSAAATQPQLPTQQSAINGTEVHERAPSPVTQPQPPMSSPSAVQFNVNVSLEVCSIAIIIALSNPMSALSDGSTHAHSLLACSVRFTRSSVPE
jgi:pSer/pThr/pTyr-binding forkhead associated (FHA) protein